MLLVALERYCLKDHQPSQMPVVMAVDSNPTQPIGIAEGRSDLSYRAWLRTVITELDKRNCPRRWTTGVFVSGPVDG